MTDSSRKRRTEQLIAARAVAVIRLEDPATVAPTVEALVGGGVMGIEVTLTVPDAFAQIRSVSETFDDDVLLGVGSVLTAGAARDAVEAGARFVVSPILQRDIIETAHELGVPALPGAFTPTEIQTAHTRGADIVKVFPANVVGMPFFKAVRAPMPHLRLMPTGGVSLTNAGEWLKAGACAVGVGSALVDRTAVANGDFNQIEENARTLMASIHSVREEG